MIVNKELPTMIIEEEDTEATVTSLKVVWRNSLGLVQAHLRARQATDPYSRWAEQAQKIRARRFNWDATHIWVAEEC
jgi:hypothetical protein